MLPASATDAVEMPGGESSRPRPRPPAARLFAREHLRMVADRPSAVDLDDVDQRLGVIALAGDEPLRGSLERGRGREIGGRGELAPFGGLRPELGVDLAAQSRARAAIEREEARTDGRRQ